jgi:hypothetical protein
MAEIKFISLIQLIQHPEKYHDQPVRVIGAALLVFESKALFVTSEDLQKAVTKNAVWLDVELKDETKKLSNKHVLVEGVFDKENLGHLKMYSGTITKVKRLEEWKSS